MSKLRVAPNPPTAEKPFDAVAYEPVMCAVSKAMAWILDQLAPDGMTNLTHALEDAAPEDTCGWLHSVVGEALRSALDDIDGEYRKLGTNLYLKEAAALEKALEKPKGGA